MNHNKLVAFKCLSLVFILVLGIITIVGSGGGGGGDNDGDQVVVSKPRDQINYETLGRVCSGHGVPLAGHYIGAESGPHPVIFSFSWGYMNPPQGGAGTSDWWRSLPPSWYNDHKESVGNIELVACVSDDFDVIVGGPCQYNIGADIYLARHARKIVLRDARTAAVIAEKIFKGSDPGPCPRTAPINQTREYGDYYHFGEVGNWLRAYVYP